MFSPQSEQGAGNFVIPVGFVMVQVNGSACAVILTSCMNHCGVLEASEIFRKGILVERGGGQPIESRFEPKLGAVANHGFRERRFLDQEKPMITGRRPFLGHVVKK